MSSPRSSLPLLAYVPAAAWFVMLGAVWIYGETSSGRSGHPPNVLCGAALLPFAGLVCGGLGIAALLEERGVRRATGDSMRKQGTAISVILNLVVLGLSLAALGLTCVAMSA